MESIGHSWPVRSLILATLLLWSGLGPAAALEWNEREANGVTKPDDAHFPLTIEHEGEVYPRESVTWKDRVLAGRTADYSLEYDFGAQVGRVEPPKTVTTTYHDRTTGAQVETELDFVELQTGDGSSRGREEELFAHSSWDGSGYSLTDGVVLPFNSDRPSIAAGEVGDALLEALHYDPAQYRLIASVWLGDLRETDGKYTREALYTVERDAAPQSAIYRGDVALPDAVVYDGIARYSSPSISSTEEWERTQPGAVDTARITPRTGDGFPSAAAYALGAIVPAGGVALGAAFAKQRRMKRLSKAACLPISDSRPREDER